MLPPERARRCGYFVLRKHIRSQGRGVDNLGHGFRFRRQLKEDCELLARNLRTNDRYAGDVAARPIEAGDNTKLNRVARREKDDGNGGCCRPRRSCRGETAGCGNHRDVASHSRGAEFGVGCSGWIACSELLGLAPCSSRSVCLLSALSALTGSMPTRWNAADGERTAESCSEVHVIAPRSSASVWARVGSLASGGSGCGWTKTSAVGKSPVCIEASGSSVCLLIGTFALSGFRCPAWGSLFSRVNTKRCST